MKNIFLYFFLMILSTQIVLAQGNNRAKIKSLKIAHITEKVELDEKQAEKFWPIYNEFETKKRELRRQSKEMLQDDANDNNDEELKDQEQILILRQKEIDLSKAYRDKFLKVLSPVQYSKLQDAERSFNTMLLNKLKERKP